MIELPSESAMRVIKGAKSCHDNYYGVKANGTNCEFHQEMSILILEAVEEAFRSFVESGKTAYEIYRLAWKRESEADFQLKFWNSLTEYAAKKDFESKTIKLFGKLHPAKEEMQNP